MFGRNRNHSIPVKNSKIINIYNNHSRISLIFPFRLRSCGINYSDPNLLEQSHRDVPDPGHERYTRKVLKFHQSLSTKFFYHAVCIFINKKYMKE